MAKEPKRFQYRPGGRPHRVGLGLRSRRAFFGNRLREQLLYSVAHELRGPLMVLDNALEILDTEYPRLTAEEFGQVLGTARRTSRRMRTLMEDLLSAGSIQSGHFVVAPRRTDLEAIVSDALDIVGPPIEGRGQKVVLVAWAPY